MYIVYDGLTAHGSSSGLRHGWAGGRTGADEARAIVRSFKKVVDAIAEDEDEDEDEEDEGARETVDDCASSIRPRETDRSASPIAAMLLPPEDRAAESWRQIEVDRIVAEESELSSNP